MCRTVGVGAKWQSENDLSKLSRPAYPALPRTDLHVCCRDISPRRVLDTGIPRLGVS